MIWSIFSSGSNMYLKLLSLLIAFPALLFSLSCHEYAHGFAAYKQGDYMAKNMGRLTLNPFRHLDPIGAISMLVFGFGWARPVPVNPAAFKNGRKSALIVALAGIVTNFCLAFISAFLLYFIKYVVPFIWTTQLLSSVLLVIVYALQYLIMINCALAVFNLIPIPPLDGYRVVKELFETPKNMNFFLDIERYQTWILLAFLVFGNRLNIVSNLSGLAQTAIFKIMDLIFTAFM